MNGGDESEKSSTVVGGTAEKQRLEILYDVSIEKLLVSFILFLWHYYWWCSLCQMDYVKRHQQTLQITEPLKVYHIQSIVTRSNQLILATSYGPMILSFSFLAVSIFFK